MSVNLNKIRISIVMLIVAVAAIAGCSSEKSPPPVKSPVTARQIVSFDSQEPFKPALPTSKIPFGGFEKLEPLCIDGSRDEVPQIVAIVNRYYNTWVSWSHISLVGIMSTKTGLEPLAEKIWQDATITPQPGGHILVDASHGKIKSILPCS